MTSSRRPSSGFTLIEIIVVTLVIGMAIVAGLAGFARPARLALSETGGALLALAESARSSARLHGAARTLVYDLDAVPQKAWIEIPPPADDPTRDPEAVLETELPREIRLSAIETGPRERAESGVVRLAADPSGFLSPHFLRLSAGEGVPERTGVIRGFPGASRLIEGTPGWDDLMQGYTEEDPDGVKPLPPEEK